MSSLSLVVLCSGRGSNLQALIDAATKSSIELRAVLSDKPSCSALERARAAGIGTHALRPGNFADRAAFDRTLFALANDYQPDLIVLAGYMRVIDDAIVAQWRGRMINIHPSLLPNYPGLHTHQRVLNAGDSKHGASVHFVSAELDGGPVIAQVEIHVAAGDDATTLAARLLAQEHQLLIATVNLFAQRRVVLDGHCVRVDGTLLGQPLRLDAHGALALPTPG